MNDTPQTSLLPDTDADAVPTGAGGAPEGPAVKPVRKRRSAKPDEAPVAVDAVEAAPDATTSVSGHADEAAPKPKRRRPPKVDAPVTADGSSDAAGAESAGSQAATPAAADTVVAATPDHAAQTPPTEAVADTANPVSESAHERSAQADGPSDDSPRGRRRGRRERHRAERGEPGEVLESNGVSQGPPAPAPMQAGELFAKVLSGAFDVEGEAGVEAEEPDTEAAATKRVLLPEVDAPKLHKVLAQSGIGSRRDMEVLIQDGHVSVNGEVAHVGQRVSFGDRVQVNGKPVRLRIVPPPPRIIAYHKPVGEIVTHDDPENRPTVFRRLPRLQQGKWQSVGRLDINTEGLLLFTTSGELANQLMHPRFGVEREYAVRVLGLLSEADKASLLSGVDVEGQTASFRSIEDGGGDGANHWYRVVITEGRNREVRKLFDTVELTVSRLIRIRYGTVVLPLGLKRGVWVDLGESDVRAIRRLASGDAGPREERGRGNERAGGQAARNQRQEPRQNARGERGERTRPHPAHPRGREGDAPPAALAMGEGRERGPNDDSDLDFDPASIPNPLEQTFDKRFAKNPRSPVGGRGFGRGGGGFGAGGSAPIPAKKVPGEPNQPDPLQTSLGFIGADAYHRKSRGGNSGGGRGGNSGAGGGGGRGGGGNSFGGNRGNSGGGGRRGR